MLRKGKRRLKAKKFSTNWESNNFPYLETGIGSLVDTFHNRVRVPSVVYIFFIYLFFYHLISHVKETIRGYFKQLREETSLRMLDRLYNEDGSPNKWWMAFSKRKFMGITMI